MKKTIILASSSPRRIEMMHKHGYNPTIMPADIDETLPKNISAKDAVMFLALKKALYVEQKAAPGSIIIAADTVVYKDGILGKPENRSDAARMLRKIKNTSHQVATGVAILIAGESTRNVFYDITEVFCKDFNDDELSAYLDTDEPYDKAGAYAIQGIFAKHIDHWNGSFDTVVGFPWELIQLKLKELLTSEN
ncbi:nucleoside triphosphate pyrophosphatase [Emergencia sp. 1XD21-10]|uniref:Maf family protein n=1 Tax=Emergencia sp. 1XD21-10 TaxID=2304569 RepID=UPI00137ACC35|nr:Maf family protein [Emergencia sp. 1XD21-10]NCE98519.1 septum formation protein Maf [Emergencia sp. 1XD21-10]